MKTKTHDFMKDIYKQIGENDANQDVVDWLGTGLLSINEMLSGKYDGGFPVGRITEVYGGASSGKTLLATMAMIETQKKGGLAVFLDYEHAFSIGRGRKLGLSDNTNDWIYKQPDTAEQGFTIIETIADMVRKADTEKFVTVVIDSVASMVTKEELETDYGAENMRTRNSLPMLMSSSLKKLVAMVNKTNITLIFLNQTRDNPGVMFGSKEKTAGGNALKFYASVRVKLRKGQKIKEGKDTVGENIHAETVKNKTFDPFRQCEYITHFKNGINLEYSHVDLFVEKELITKAGAWFSMDSERIGQGKQAVADWLIANPKEYKKLLAAATKVKK